MSPRQSRSGSRSTRARGARGGKSTGRGNSHSRPLSAGRRAASNSSRAASTRRPHAGRAGAARAKRARRSESSAPHAVQLLKQDHRAVAEALEEFESARREEKEAIARHICRMITVHTQIEEELLYPAARAALKSGDGAHLVAEAHVEHASVKDLIQQIESLQRMDEEYEAKVCVMGEYVKHHVSEEENELFPKLERTSLDLDALGERLEERKRELMGEEAGAWSPKALGRVRSALRHVNR